MDEYTYHVVDLGDNFILFSGSKRDCFQVQKESYGGLVVLPDIDPRVKKIKGENNHGT